MAGLGECDVGPLHPEDEVVTEVRQERGSSEFLPYIHDQILFSVRATRYLDLACVQEPQVHRRTWEGQRLELDQLEFVHRGRSDLP